VRSATRTPSRPVTLVKRQFTASGPNRLWVTDITEHPTAEGKLYCAAVLDVYSRRIVGWSIAEHIRTELVLDALGMAVVRRTPQNGETVLHSNHGSHTRFRGAHTRILRRHTAAGALPDFRSQPWKDE